nr:MAG TPA: hypothetical protein [Caudoviricetes sp.]
MTTILIVKISQKTQEDVDIDTRMCYHWAEREVW